MLRIGATEEGTLRQHMINSNGSSRDSVYFSILDGEWAGVKDRLRQMLVSAPPKPATWRTSSSTSSRSTWSE